MSNQPDDDGRDGLPSASAMERRACCPGSKAAEAAYPQVGESAIADQGSRIHRARETGVVTGLSDEEIQIVQGLQEIEDEAVKKWRHDIGAPSDEVIPPVKEERLWVRKRDTLQPLASAKIDRYWRWRVWALVIDDKSGFLPATPSPRNWQLRTAALSLKSEIPELAGIRVAISQKRFRSRYDACDYDAYDLAHAETELLHVLWRCDQPDAGRYPGSWCRYCSAKARCPQFAAYSMLPVVKLNPEYDPKLRGQSLKTEIATRVSLLSNEDLAFLYDKRHIMAGIQEAVKDRLRQLSELELNQVGLALEQSASVREVTDLDGAFNILMRSGLMSVDEFHACCSLTLGKVEELMKKRLMETRKLDNQKDALEVLRKMLSPTFTMQLRQPQVVKWEPPVPPAPVQQQLTPEPTTENATESEPVVKESIKKTRVKRTNARKVTGKNPGKKGVHRQGSPRNGTGQRAAPPPGGGVEPTA